MDEERLRLGRERVVCLRELEHRRKLEAAMYQALIYKTK